MKKLFLVLITLLAFNACTSEQMEDIIPAEDNIDLTVCDNEWIPLNNGAYVKKEGDEYLLEGDMVLTQEQVDLLTQPATRSGFITDVRKYWPYGRVYYTVASDFDKNSQLQQAINHLENFTNIRLIRRTSESNYIEFQKSTVTNSNVGMIGGKQIIRAASWADWYDLVHEIGHAIGLIHEHSRHDRDDYIRIHWDNIPSNLQHNFTKYTISNSGISNFTRPFDYNSIMIYSSFITDAINPSQPIITRIDNGGFVSKQEQLSREDMISINNLYSITPKIDGDQAVLLPYRGGYHIWNNIPKYSTITWNVFPAGTGQIVSGQGTAHIDLSITSNSVQYLEATINYPDGTTSKASTNIRASNAPIVTDIELFKYGGGNGEYTVKAWSTDPHATFTWRASGGRHEFRELTYPGDASFVEYPNIFKEILFYVYGLYTITVTATNRYGSHEFSKSFYAHDSVDSSW